MNERTRRIAIDALGDMAVTVDDLRCRVEEAEAERDALTQRVAELEAKRETEADDAGSPLTVRMAGLHRDFVEVVIDGRVIARKIVSADDAIRLRELLGGGR